MVNTLVQLLHRELCEYRSLSGISPRTPGQVGHESASLSMLRQGLALLHTLALHDPHFTRHHHQVEHQYVELVCGADRVYRQLGEECVTEAEGEWVEVNTDAGSAICK